MTAGLLAASAAFCTLERRMHGLIKGPDHVADDDAHQQLLRPPPSRAAPPRGNCGR